MLVRNLLQAGDFVEPLPLGLPVTLKYQDTGTLQSVIVGYDVETGRESRTALEACIKQSIVPSHITSTDGTVYVRGVLYSGKSYLSSGTLPQCLETDIVSLLSVDVNFNFFAGQVTATGINFLTVTQIRSWLQSNGFNLLPGFVVPSGDIDFNLRKLINGTTFDYDLVFGYFVFNKNEFSAVYLGKHIHQISNIDIYLDASGYVHAAINFDDYDTITTSYYDVEKYQLYTGDRVIFNDDNSIVCNYTYDGTSSPNYEYTCPFCNRIYTIEDEFTRCPDQHCMSKAYPDIQHLLLNLGLGSLNYDDFMELYTEGEITTVDDIFDLPQYKAVQISVDLASLLDAVIPLWAVRNRNSIWEFYSKCNGSWESVLHYLSCPEDIAQDLGVIDSNLVTWFNDPLNTNFVANLVNRPNIEITGTAKKFEGSPIFRDKNIYLTGKFMHGTYAEVSAILKSYGAEVTSWEIADCCILGDIPEDIDGSVVNAMRSNNLQVFTETEFFNLYDIDSDLQ